MTPARYTQKSPGPQPGDFISDSLAEAAFLLIQCQPHTLYSGHLQAFRPTIHW